jgi:chromosomal replication initiation ATPase DnaA
MMKTNTVEIEQYWPTAAPSRMGMAQAIVAHAYDVKLDDLTAATRGDPRAARARQVTMYLAHVVFGMNFCEIARAFGRDRSTALYACHRIEDLREDPDCDRSIGWLESMLRGAVK